MPPKAYCMTRKPSPKCTYSLLRTFIGNINLSMMISLMNTNPNKLPLCMDIDMSGYYKYFSYQYSWVIVHSGILSNKLVTCYFIPTKVSKLFISRRIWIQMSSRCNGRYDSYWTTEVKTVQFPQVTVEMGKWKRALV